MAFIAGTGQFSFAHLFELEMLHGDFHAVPAAIMFG